MIKMKIILAFLSLVLLAPSINCAAKIFHPSMHLYPNAYRWFLSMANKHPEQHLDKIAFGCDPKKPTFCASSDTVFFPKADIQHIEATMRQDNPPATALNTHKNNLHKYEGALLHEAYHVNNNHQTKALAVGSVTGTTVAAMLYPYCKQHILETYNSTNGYRNANSKDMAKVTSLYAASAFIPLLALNIAVTLFSRFVLEKNADNNANMHSSEEGLSALISFWKESIQNSNFSNNPMTAKLQEFYRDPNHPSLTSRLQASQEAYNKRFKNIPPLETAQQPVAF